VSKAGVAEALKHVQLTDGVLNQMKTPWKLEWRLIASKVQ
jgi:hypothetical protein